jgi:hypothetical protein
MSQEPAVYNRDEILSPSSFGQVGFREGSDIEEPTFIEIAFDNGTLDTKDSGVRSIIAEDGLTEKVNFDEELSKVEEAI